MRTGREGGRAGAEGGDARVEEELRAATGEEGAGEGSVATAHGEERGARRTVMAIAIAAAILAAAAATAVDVGREEGRERHEPCEGGERLGRLVVVHEGHGVDEL